MVTKPTNLHLCVYVGFITVSNSNEMFQNAACCSICPVIIMRVHRGLVWFLSCAPIKLKLLIYLSIFISVINQVDAQNFCFTISLFHVSTCFEHVCLSSGGQKCITQLLVSSHL